MQDHNTTDFLKPLEELYLAKSFGAARKLLLENKSQLDPGQFHYNLGTIDVKLGNLAAGRYHFEKAIKSGFSDIRLSNNLEYVKENLQLEGISSSTRPIEQLLDRSTYWNQSVFFTMSLIMLIGVIFLMRKKIVKRLWPIAILVILSLSPIGVKSLLLDDVTSAIVLKAAARYEGPSAIFEKLSTINAGSKLVIKVHDGKWALILAPRKLVGWVKLEQLGLY